MARAGEADRLDVPRVPGPPRDWAGGHSGKVTGSRRRSAAVPPTSGSNKRGAGAVTVSITYGVAMSIIGWLVLGLIAGFIASKVVNKTGEGIIVDILLGIAGAFAVGFLFTSF